MHKAANLAVGLVAALHVVIAVVEMFFWKSLKVYERLERLDLNQAEAEKVAPIVANMGLYNAFIAAGLVCTFIPAGDSRFNRWFFLSCVVIAGIVGAITIKWTTLIIQTLPALVAILLLWWIANQPAPHRYS